VTPAALKRYCLSLTGAVATHPFGPEHTVYKVEGKIFAITAHGPTRVSLKCEPELAEQLRAAYPAIQPGYHLNKRHWNTIELDGSIEDALVRNMIEDSYDLVVSALSQAKRQRLGWDGASFSQFGSHGGPK
jgi:predicted DNA-binding protein (MmcQ/YjbR family)